MKNHKRLIRIFHSLILLSRIIDFRYTFYVKKTLVDPTDSTYPESTPVVLQLLLPVILATPLSAASMCC